MFCWGEEVVLHTATITGGYDVREFQVCNDVLADSSWRSKHATYGWDAQDEDGILRNKLVVFTN